MDGKGLRGRGGQIRGEMKKMGLRMKTFKLLAVVRWAQGCCLANEKKKNKIYTNYIS